MHTHNTMLRLLAASMALVSFITPVSAQSPTTVSTEEIIGLELLSSDNATTRQWKQIGIDPYTGDVLTAGRELSTHTAIRISEVQEAWEMRRRGDCTSYNLKDGDELRTTHGQDKSMPAKVSFGSEGNHPERRGDVCIVRPDGTAVIFLDGCGNISVARAIRNIPLLPVKRILTAPPAPKPQCRWVRTQVTNRPGQMIQTPGFFMTGPNCCPGCGGTGGMFLPGAGLYSGDSGSALYELVCE